MQIARYATSYKATQAQWLTLRDANLQYPRNRVVEDAYLGAGIYQSIEVLMLFVAGKTDRYDRQTNKLVIGCLIFA